MRRLARQIALLVLLSAATARAAEPKRPNIVVLLADDLGYGSAGVCGADPNLLSTPTIDALAHQGVRFTDASTPSSVCSPSRYSILTGRYAWRSSLKRGVLDSNAPLLIDPTRVTLASVLKSAGYDTAAIGKWHLGYGTAKKVKWTEELKPGPLELGFDYHFGIPSVHSDPVGVYIEDHSVWGLRSTKLTPFGKNYYGEKFIGLDAPQRVDKTVMATITAHALDWLDKQTADKPFFLYYAPVAPHEPTTPGDEFAGHSKAGPYGDWIQELDGDCGKILAKLDQKHLAENTLVIFTSDNGGENKHTRDGTQLQAQAAGLKINGDLRAGKHSIYEGGTRVPFIVRWPGKVPADTTCAQPIGVIDLLATAAAVVGQPLPDPDQGAEDSLNILPEILNPTAAPPIRTQVITHNVDGVFAIRDGKWKYVEGKPAPPLRPDIKDFMAREQTPQLYNLESDLAESTNVADNHAEIVQRLSDELDTVRSASHTR